MVDVENIPTDLVSVLVMAASEMCFQTLHKAHFSTSSLDQLGNSMGNIEAIDLLVICQKLDWRQKYTNRIWSHLLSALAYHLPMNPSLFRASMITERGKCSPHRSFI